MNPILRPSACAAPMNEPHIYQELGSHALEPLQPGERKLIGLVFLFGLALLGALFFLQRWLPLGG